MQPASIRRALRDPPPANSQTAEVCGGLSWYKDCKAINSRADAVPLVLPRTGHTRLLKAYTKLPDPFAKPLCPLCKGGGGNRQSNTG